MKRQIPTPWAASFILLMCLLSPFSSCAADAVREAAIQFGTGWVESFHELGISGLGNYQMFYAAKEKLNPHRKVMRESGSKELRQAGEQLDKLFIYVARLLCDHGDNLDHERNWTRPGEKPPS